MFGRKQTTETRTGRYRSKHFTVPKGSDALSTEIERAMNAGDARGWRLINVTQHAATVRLHWDTRAQ